MKSIVDVDGTRTVVQIIKAPELLKNFERRQFSMESPTKVARPQSQSILVNKGFTSYIKPIIF